MPAPGAAPPEAERHSPFHHGLVGRLRNYFLTGLILVGPAYITISLTWWFINWVDDLVRPFIPVAYRPETYLPVKIPGSGLIIALVALTLLGFLTANFVGRKLVVNMPDGTQLIIIDGAVFVPQLVLGGVEVPATNVAALLIGQEPQPAAGELPPSSGGNWRIRRISM